MSDKEKALDALQVIINLSACHNMTTVNNEIIKQSEIIKRAVSKIPDEPTTEGERVSCFYIGMPGHSVPVSAAQEQYNACDSTCAACGRCQ